MAINVDTRSSVEKFRRAIAFGEAVGAGLEGIASIIAKHMDNKNNIEALRAKWNFMLKLQHSKNAGRSAGSIAKDSPSLKTAKRIQQTELNLMNIDRFTQNALKNPALTDNFGGKPVLKKELLENDRAGLKLLFAQSVFDKMKGFRDEIIDSDPVLANTKNKVLNRVFEVLKDPRVRGRFFVTQGQEGGFDLAKLDELSSLRPGGIGADTGPEAELRGILFGGDPRSGDFGELANTKILQEAAGLSGGKKSLLKSRGRERTELLEDLKKQVLANPSLAQDPVQKRIYQRALVNLGFDEAQAKSSIDRIVFNPERTIEPEGVDFTPDKKTGLGAVAGGALLGPLGIPLGGLIGKNFKKIKSKILGDDDEEFNVQ